MDDAQGVSPLCAGKTRGWKGRRNGAYSNSALVTGGTPHVNPLGPRSARRQSNFTHLLGQSQSFRFGFRPLSRLHNPKREQCSIVPLDPVRAVLKQYPMQHVLFTLSVGPELVGCQFGSGRLP